MDKVESMKSLELMKSIEPAELIGLIRLIESNQVNKKFTTCALFGALFQ